MDYIHLKNIQGAINKLNRMFDDAEDQQDLAVRLADFLKQARTINEKRKVFDSKITGRPLEKMASQHQQNASILSLVQLFKRRRTKGYD